MNEGKNIPGIIYLTLLDDSNLKGKYVYLYNEGKDKYELLNTKIKQGEVKIDSPRDRDGSFEPVVIPKRTKDVSDIENKVLAMYARGMSQRDISKTIEDIYGF